MINRNNAARDIVKTFLTKNNKNYLTMYREVRKKTGLTNIDGRTLKFYGCSLNEEQLGELNLKLAELNVNAIIFKPHRFTASSIKVINI